MTYSAEELERLFRDIALSRISRKDRGNKRYEKDSGYWTGGKCNWGGSHSLKEDCETLVQNLNKLDSLKNVEQELRKCTSEQEFNSVKSRSIRQAEELERGLQAKIDYTADDNQSKSNSVFGICIIWDDYQDFTTSKIKLLQSKIRRLKEDISKERYKYYEELKSLRLKQKQIEDRIKENKAKSEKEPNPAQKALLLQMIEDDGKKLKENLEKQKEIPTSNLRFDSDKYVSDFIKGLNKRTVRGGENNSGSSDSESDDNSSDETTSNNDNNSNWFQNNQHLIIVTGLILLLIVYFYYSQEEEPNYYDF